MLRRHTLITLLTTLLLFPAASIANTPLADSPATIVIAQSEGLTLEQATAQVREQTGGRILSASESTRDGRKVYRIKVLLPSGHVRVVTINADGS